MSTNARCIVTLRFNNATSTRDRTAAGHLTPKRIMAYGRTFDRATGLVLARGRDGATTVRVISYQEDGQPTVLLG